jgi:WD40 repeat protein
VALSDDGEYAAAVYGTYSVKLLLWKVRSGNLVKVLPSVGMSFSLAFSPDTRKLALAGRGNITVFNVPTLSQCDSFAGGSGMFVSSVRFLSNNALVSSGPDRQIHWWTVKK